MDDYVKKGGKLEDTVGRKCICNGLMTAIGYGQNFKEGGVEPALFTSGDDVSKIGKFVNWDTMSYSANDVLKILMED